MVDWLSFSEQKLLAFTSGKVFYDGLGEIEAVRRKFSYYPDDGLCLKSLKSILDTVSTDCVQVRRPTFEAKPRRCLRERETRLATAYEMIARQHNELQPMSEQVSEHGRPYRILQGHRFGAAIWRKITSEEIRRMGFLGGSVNQFVESDDEVSNVQLCRKLRMLYE